MAASSLLALIDDIATVLDDVALMTKIAAKKTAGVLGDDLALNAQQVTGVRAEREIPVVIAVAKGSLFNKLILVPAALLLSALAPMLINPLLMLGGAYLCYEGCEKVVHVLFHSKAEKDQEHQKISSALADPNVDLVDFEKNKIKGAIRTDFILSAEIIVIALGTVATQSFVIQLSVVASIAFAMTIGVYGLVAGIVKLDDAGMHLMATARKTAMGKIQYQSGLLLLNTCPYLMKTLSIVGTIAMFLVGGGILVHGFAFLHHVNEAILLNINHTWLVAIMPSLFNLVMGLIAGGIILALVSAVARLRSH